MSDETQVKPELLPCPFCGGEALSFVDDGKTYAGCSVVTCRSVWFSPAEWNTRADDTDTRYAYRALESDLGLLREANERLTAENKRLRELECSTVSKQETAEYMESCAEEMDKRTRGPVVHCEGDW